jgi:hypothetical protein
MHYAFFCALLCYARYCIHAHINFNKNHARNKLTPKYTNVKKKKAGRGKEKPKTLCTENEIKFLYHKKQQLNKEFYHIHKKMQIPGSTYMNFH